MKPATRLYRLVQAMLDPLNLAIVRKERVDYQVASGLPEGAAEYLTKDNPRLRELIAGYERLDNDLTCSDTWNWKTNAMSASQLRQFRGETMYVWQQRGLNNVEARYALTTYYTVANDRLRLMSVITDDGLFGNHLFEGAGYKVSRDLLDSVNEINFLEDRIKITSVPGLKILDIGAGYGRLAHRVTQCLPNVSAYYCTDGVPFSVFLCEYYLKHRKIDNAVAVPMFDVQNALKGEKIHLAVNIHSFSEATLAAIDWWIRLVAELDIRYLMIVPNANVEGGGKLMTNKREDFQSTIEKYGYRLIHRQSKYCDRQVQRFGIYPTYYYLFEKMV